MAAVQVPAESLPYFRLICMSRKRSKPLSSIATDSASNALTGTVAGQSEQLNSKAPRFKMRTETSNDSWPLHKFRMNAARQSTFAMPSHTLKTSEKKSTTPVIVM
eukprot:1564648-Prymnesium_polylepis.2